MNHFLEIEQLSKQEIEHLIQVGLSFKNRTDYPNYNHYAVANLFYENSTRTRVSFELAAKHLNMPVINFNHENSSEHKGEEIFDTISTLSAMGISVFVMRHQQEKLIHRIAAEIGEKAHLVNAGDGAYAHPTQSILDMMTIVEKKSNLADLKVAIVGDLLHSRVASSFREICQKLGVGELRMVAPVAWQPKQTAYGTITPSLKEGLEGVDVVIGLRVQRERLSKGDEMDLTEYRRSYALTQESMQYAKSDAILMHPGPINRGIEIDSEVADGPQSVILTQVQNGVFARMAVLQSILE